MRQLQGILAVLCLALLGSACSEKKSVGFSLLDPSDTGIHFTNTIRENDSLNVFKFMNIYTGAGVAVGDINNDGLTDVYFSGNMVSGRLYLNKGDMKFEDVTERSGLLNSRWGTGVTMVDINQDGWLDIYVCVSGSAEEAERANMLYINNGDLTFSEKGAEYGLADTRQSMQAVFFDYDRDQDLDMYLLVNPAAYEYKVNISQPRKVNGESISNDRLYRNEGDGTFSDVTLEAGILMEGYGLGVGISDINNDSWPDIYVSNDFIGNDVLYINRGDGTFEDRITEYINHTSYAGMGNDIADIDNNGKPDIMVLDMRPEDNYRQKLIISSTGFDRFQMMLEAGYNPQYSRNTLQLNRGEGAFSEIGFLAGVSSTDWSWSALLADYDNDGYRDLYVTNGFLRDLGNLDYIHYQNVYDNPLGDPETKIAQKLQSISELPPASLVNYAYRNNGDLTFENVSEAWGITVPSCSNGASFADLDNDGDLDVLVNNVNQPAFVYENLADRRPSNNFLRIQLNGKKGNLQGIGSRIRITADSLSQYYEHYLSRGYESAVDPVIHFGLGPHQLIDTLEIWWPDGSYQRQLQVQANRLLALAQEDAGTGSKPVTRNSGSPLFTESTDSLGLSFRHREDPMVDFKLQPILPHMHSRGGPGIAVADANGDGLEDFFVGGASGQAGSLFFQDAQGAFTQREWSVDAAYEDMGSLFFDADGDGDQDLYVVSGGVVAGNEENPYQDRLYVNDGEGNFTKSLGLPQLTASGSLVTAMDFDRDGDLDLFVGGRVSPGRYPMPARSYLLENISDREGGTLQFRDISQEIPGWEQLSMVSGALWSDYDDDGWVDLVACGEFMPITLFHNENGKLRYVSEVTGLNASGGWWNSISGADFDGDGDTDYLLGNLGLNSKYKASEEEPLCIYAKDYDKDGRVDPVMCYFIGDENYLAHSRDEIIGQISAMRGRFKTYESYARTSFKESFLPEELEDAHVVKAETLASAYMENLGNGSFALRPLPTISQMGPIEGMVIADADADGHLDAILSGNSYTTEVATGRYDAIKGILLKGDGQGGFTPVPLERSGFLNDDDASGMALARNATGGSYLIIANNDAPLKAFTLNRTEEGGGLMPISADSKSALLLFLDGRQRKVEFYYGSGYLSQSTRSLLLPAGVKEVRVLDFEGKTKTIYP